MDKPQSPAELVAELAELKRKSAELVDQAAKLRELADELGVKVRKELDRSESKSQPASQDQQ